MPYTMETVILKNWAGDFGNKIIKQVRPYLIDLPFHEDIDLEIFLSPYFIGQHCLVHARLSITRHRDSGVVSFDTGIDHVSLSFDGDTTEEEAIDSVLRDLQPLLQRRRDFILQLADAIRRHPFLAMAHTKSRQVPGALKRSTSLAGVDFDLFLTDHCVVIWDWRYYRQVPPRIALIEGFGFRDFKLSLWLGRFGSLGEMTPYWGCNIDVIRRYGKDCALVQTRIPYDLFSVWEFVQYLEDTPEQKWIEYA